MSRKRRANQGWITSPAAKIVMPIVIAGTILGVIAAWSGETRAQHPHPRPGITAVGVVPAEQYAAYPRIARIYGEVAEIPHVIDGIFCFCDCHDSIGHHSLLDCFHSDHGAACNICLAEADMAYRMTQEGRSLEEIRAAIDAAFKDRH